MGRPTDHDVDLGFDQVAILRRLERDWHDFRSPEFWRRLNPQLTVSEQPVKAGGAPSVAVSAELAESARKQLDDLGFFVTPPLIPAALMAPVREAVETLAAVGIPSGFVAVYDEVYQCFGSVRSLFEPLLGADYLWVADGLWVFLVPAGAPARNGLLSPFAAHRDSLGPDPAVVGGGRPTILTVWIPLTDVSPAESCLYVVPRSADDQFQSGAQGVTADSVDLQSIRAVPAAAGSVIHWGSRSWADARGPRIAITTYFQRADVPPFHESVFRPTENIALETRLRWVVKSMGGHDLVKRLSS
jgi:hypothetical protein